MSRRRVIEEPAVLKRLRGKHILLVDDNDRFRATVKQKLRDTSFERVETARNPEEAWRCFERQRPDLVIADIHLQDSERDGLDLLHDFEVHGYEGLSAVVSGDQSVDQVYRALIAGADDYWVKGAYFNPVFEVVDLLERPAPRGGLKWEPENIARLGFFRTCGATPAEIRAVIDYSRNFDRYSAVAGDTGRSYQQISRTYSRVKQKCGCESLSQFGRLITLCELIGSRSRP